MYHSNSDAIRLAMVASSSTAGEVSTDKARSGSSAASMLRRNFRGPVGVEQMMLRTKGAGPGGAASSPPLRTHGLGLVGDCAAPSPPEITAVKLRFSTLYSTELRLAYVRHAVRYGTLPVLR